MEFELTKAQSLIAEKIEFSHDNILVHGKPGVGKSVLIRHLVENGNKTYTLAAPTGLAALNIGGKTLHSLFGIPVSQGIIHPTFNKFTINDRVCNFVKYKVKHLIIDEISMVRADVLDYVDRFIRSVKNVDLPFGGIQVIMVGDFYQIPPVATREDIVQLHEAGYNSPFAFDSNAFKSSNITIMNLDEVLRQKGDNKFIKILHSARKGLLNTQEVEILNKRVKQPTELTLRLTGTNKQADEINYGKLRGIPGEPVKFMASQFGEWPAYPVEQEVTLKVGAQVMIKMNGADRPEGYKGEFISSIVNGTLAKVVDIKKAGEATSEADCPIKHDHIIVELEDGTRANIYRKRWERKVKERIGEEWEERVVATFEQMPITLAWAISIHKSQGQSFDTVHIDSERIFAPGQLYVALSRCRSLKGLTLQQQVNGRKFWANRDVIQFFNELTEQQ